MKILNCIINLFFILTHGFWYIPVANDFIFARKRQGIERSLPSHISEEELAENWCKENEDWCEAKLYQKSESQFYRFFKKIKFDLKSVISTVIRSLKSACLQVYQVILTENIFLWTVFSVLWFETCGNVSWKYLLTKLIILMYARMELQTNLEGLIFICLGLVGILKSAILDAFVFMWLHIKKDDNFGICLFLQGAIRILLVKKIFHCSVVAEENSSPKNDKSGEKDDSNSSQSSSEPEHEFSSVEKTYKKGSLKEGQTHTVDTLLIHPYVFTKGTTHKNITYFMCQGCRKYKKYVMATATKEESGEWKLIKAPGDHICWTSSEDKLKKEFSRKMYSGISDNPRKSVPKMFNDLTEEMTKGMSIVQKRRFKQIVSQYKGIQSGLYKHRNEKIPTQPKTMVSIRHRSFHFSQLILCDNYDLLFESSNIFIHF
jgi:hypothetical protein